MIHPVALPIVAALPDWIALPAAGWWAVLGAVVGSFLNVLVYRLPRGESIVVPASRCPRCGRAIRWHDNVPVLGWFLLGGRCRDCREPISPRYPAVEAATAALFLVVGALEYAAQSPGATGGSAQTAVAAATSRPARMTPQDATNLSAAPSATRREMPNGTATASASIGNEEDTGVRLARAAAAASYDLLLLCALFCAALIAHDGFEVPWSLFAPVIVVALAAPLPAPWLRAGPHVLPGPSGPLAVLVEGAAGLATGTLLGFLAARATRLGVLLPASAAVGVVLGWTAPVVVVPLGVLLGRFVSRRGLVVGWWLVGSLAWLVPRAF